MAATSTTDAWAAGRHYNGTADQTLTERWNGTAWKTVTSPDPGGSGNRADLFGVAATSATNAWAVGQFCNGTVYQTLAEHWNGTAWNRVASPNPGGMSDLLSGVAAFSTTNAWAVGQYSSTSTEKTLIERWNGTAWKQVTSPSPGNSRLLGVSAASATDAWAVGDHYDPTTQKTLTLILHWNGTAWKQVASPSPGTVGLDTLSGVSATSATNAWAVGQYYNGTAYQTLTLHWNGTAWKTVASPNPSGSTKGNSLSGVAATSAADAWAIGLHVNGSTGGGLTLILHWNGTAWKQVASPNFGPAFPGDNLSGVAATSATNAWAVGKYYNGSADQTLILHWNGTIWARVTSP